MDETLRFQLDPQEIKKWPEEDYEVIERAQDGELRLYRLRPIMARYMVDENGAKLPETVALKRLGQIPIDEWNEVIRKFGEGVQSIALPNGNGRQLNSLSAVDMPPTSPDGSQP